MTETTIASEEIYSGKVIRVRKDTVQFENGKTATRDIVEHNGAIAVVPMLNDETIVLVSQFRMPTKKSLLEIPAGSINPGEEIEACVHRELIEETQFKAGRIEKLFSMYVAPGYSTEIIHLYVAHDLTPEHGVGDDDEYIDLVKVTIDKAVQMIYDGEIEDAKSIAGLLAVSAKRLGK